MKRYNELFCKKCKMFTFREHPTLKCFNKCNFCGYTEEDIEMGCGKKKKNGKRKGGRK